MTDTIDGALRGADALSEAIGELERSASRFGDAMVDALRGATVEGRGFEDVLRTLARRLADMALDAALKPLEKAAGGLFAGLASGLTSALTGGADGAAAGTASSVAPPVTVNVSTPDAASFQRSAGQVSAIVARSAARGRRSL